MKKEKSNKKPLIALALVALIGVLGGTFAIFSSKVSIPNVFKTAKFHSEIEEKFESPEDWKPGEDATKEVKVTNTGNVDLAVRVSYTEEWKSSTDQILPNENEGESVAIINFLNTDKWIKTEEADGTYYYYYKKLTPSSVTELFMDKVTFNPNVEYDIECTTTTTDTGTKTICGSTGEGYDDATYTLTITVETVQFDAYQDFWNTSVSITE